MTASVLVLSDTHLRRGIDLPAAVLELAARADAIVHAGDFVDPDVLDVLESLAPVYAALGNCDGHDLAARLEARYEPTIHRVPFGIVHDAGPANGRHQRLRKWFPRARILVHGHTHAPELSRHEDGVIVLNPGSSTQRRRATTHTVAWLELEDGVVADANLVDLD